jgi:hypothetical protein
MALEMVMIAREPAREWRVADGPTRLVEHIGGSERRALDDGEAPGNQSATTRRQYAQSPMVGGIRSEKIHSV